MIHKQYIDGVEQELDLESATLPSLESLIPKIIQWAEDRNLVEGSTPKTQMVKLMEEMGELAAAINRDDLSEAEDAIGDMFVVLLIILKQLNLEPAKAAKCAYDQIKHRKGRMVDGIFVKEDDLPQ